MKNTIGRLWIGMAVIASLTGCASSPDKPDPASGTVAPPTGPAAQGGADGAANGQRNVEVASAAQGSAVESATAVKPAPWGVAVVATVNKRSPVSISMGELVQPLIESHGLDLLLNIAQRDLAKQGTDEARIVVTADDFNAERERTLGLLFNELDGKIQDAIERAEREKKPDEVKKWQDERTIQRQQLLNQFYEQKHLTSTDFDILIQTNTYLRKIAEPKIKDKVTEEMLRAEFAARYGEKVRVRHIELKRPQDAIEVKRRLAAGEKFENVAHDLSANRETAAIGGELLPFTREAQLPKVFKDVAFDLKVGQVSDLVETGESYQMIKLEARIPPSKAVVYEQQRDILYRDVHEQMLQGVIAQMRRQIAQAIQESLKISEPAMNKQLQDRLDAIKATAKSKEQAEQEMAKDRDRLRLENELRARQQAATQTSTTTQPAGTAPATQPATAPAPVLLPAAPPPAAPPPAAPPPAAPPPAAPRTAPTPIAPAAPAPPTRPAAPATAPAALRTPAPRSAPAAAPRATGSATRPG